MPSVGNHKTCVMYIYTSYG